MTASVMKFVNEISQLGNIRSLSEDGCCGADVVLDNSSFPPGGGLSVRSPSSAEPFGCGTFLVRTPLDRSVDFSTGTLSTSVSLFPWFLVSFRGCRFWACDELSAEPIFEVRLSLDVRLRARLVLEVLRMG